jgi:hypothetical protein
MPCLPLKLLPELRLLPEYGYLSFPKVLAILADDATNTSAVIDCFDILHLEQDGTTLSHS